MALSSHWNIAFESDQWHISVAVWSSLLKFYHFHISLRLLSSPLAWILLLNVASKTVSGRLFSIEVKTSSVSEEMMACVTLRVTGPTFWSAFPRIRPRVEGAIQHRGYAPILSKSVFSLASVKLERVFGLPTQMTFLLLTDLIWKHEFSAFSLPLHASSSVS